LGLTNGADQRPVIDAKDLARVFYPKAMTLRLRKKALWKDDVLQAHFLQGSKTQRGFLPPQKRYWGTFPGPKNSPGEPISTLLPWADMTRAARRLSAPLTSAHVPVDCSAAMDAAFRWEGLIQRDILQ
jgi:hypothetical protein